MTDTCGTTPCRATFWKKIRPKPPSAAAPSCSRAPADSRNATSGAPAVRANCIARTTTSASAVPTEPPLNEPSIA